MSEIECGCPVTENGTDLVRRSPTRPVNKFFTIVTCVLSCILPTPNALFQARWVGLFLFGCLDVQALEGELQARPHVTVVNNLFTGNVGLSLRAYVP